MEWILILGGIAYSIWSSYKKDQREREQKSPQHQRMTAKNAADEMFARSSGRRTISHERQEVPASRYGQDVTEVQEVSLEDIQEDFTTRLNRKLLERNMALEAQGYERFGESSVPETTRYRDYDELTTYDERPVSRSSEHQYASHFKLNEGLRKDNFRVGSGEDLFAEETADASTGLGKRLPLDKESLKNYIIMHEILSKPKSIRRPERR
ncbi:MAG TPA: hypothetical protein VFH43_05775 [Candidatus Kapabacteria bacterium]|nr:hypothetical protein [Candidatus Kapabacteria bacterium]